MAAALAAGQERARQIDGVIEQTYSLAAERRLGEALLTIDAAIAKFGNEIALTERKREIEFERELADYSASLQKTIEEARRLLAERPHEAVALLEEAKFQYPGESDLSGIALRGARCDRGRRGAGFCFATLSQIAALEVAEEFEAAMALVATTVARYPTNAGLQAAAERLPQELQEQRRRRMLASWIDRIELAIRSGDWTHAAVECQDAARAFPGEETLAPFPAKIEEVRQAEIQLLQLRVHASLRQQDLDDAERQIGAAREIFPQEPVWQDLWRECQSRKQYRDKLSLARDARIRKDHALAEQILGPLLADAPDEDAADLLGEVVAERRAIEETARREEEEAHLERARAAVAKGRAEAASLARRADYRAVITLLEELASQYPTHPEIQQDRETAVHEWERQRREEEEQAQRRVQAIAAARQEAAALLGNGEAEAAVAILDRLGAEYPDATDLAKDREAAVGEWERQRREAEKARQQRKQAIAAARQEASELLRNGEAEAAVAILDRLGAEYPDATDIRQDREAAAHEWERQQREAEKARQQREHAIAAARQEASELLRNGQAQAAVAILDRLGAEYPDAIDIRQDREAAAHEWERQRREAEKARQQREQAIAAGRQEASELLRNGEAEAAVAILDRLGAEYSDATDLAKDREAAEGEWERQRREEEEQAQRRVQAIAAARQEAAALLGNGEAEAAVAILDRLGAEYPDATDLAKDREAAVGEWERQRREAEKARQQREQAIAAARQEASELLRNGEAEAAVAILDRLGAEYPDATDIRQDREAAAHEWERQQREAEKARQQREQAIAAGRQEASELLRNGEAEAAVAILDRLGAEYPDATDIRQDREAAAHEWERQQREAEKARQQREQAIAAGRQEAAALLGNGEAEAAVAILDRLGAEYSDATDLAKDREAAEGEWERQRREAEERVQAIAAARQEAAALLGNGEAEAAVAILDRLGAEYPDAIDIRQDREAAVGEWERQQREAEKARQQREQAIAAARQEASELLRNGQAEAAVAILDRLGAGYPDAIDIRQDREAAAHEWERQQREAEKARQQREHAIAAGRQEASELLGNGEAEAAVAILDRLGAEHPDAIDIRQDREAAAHEWERQQREAEKARQQREHAIAAARQEASELLRNGQAQAAVAILDRLGAEYPDAIDIRQDREAAAHEWERQQREAEKARQQREQAIAAARQEAAALLGKGQAQAAVAILDRLGAEYPDATDIRQDREAAAHEWERQQRERERAAIAEGRAKAAILVQQGNHTTAVALLDQLAKQYPNNSKILKDREAAWREWERLQREAEEQARRGAGTGGCCREQERSRQTDAEWRLSSSARVSEPPSCAVPRQFRH